MALALMRHLFVHFCSIEIDVILIVRVLRLCQPNDRLLLQVDPPLALWLRIPRRWFV